MKMKMKMKMKIIGGKGLMDRTWDEEDLEKPRELLEEWSTNSM